MFGFLKNKLKEWVDKAKDTLKPEEEIEETIEEKPKVEIKKEKKPEKKEEKKKEKIKETKPEKEEKVEKKKKEEIKKQEPIEKVDEIIAEAKQEKPAEEVPLEFNVALQKYEPNLEKIKEQSLEQKEEEEPIEEKTNLESSDLVPLSESPNASESISESESITQETKEEKKPGFISRLFGKKPKVEKEETKLESSETVPLSESPKASEPISVSEPAIQKIEEPKASEPAEQKKSFLQKVKSSFTYKISEEDFDKLFDDLEMLLLENNVALEVTEDLKKSLSKKLIGKEIKKDNLEKEIKTELKNSLDELIIDPVDPLTKIKEKKKSNVPFVILFFGINGTGKTTSIAKIANLLKENNISVVLAAADTFRAASIEQITEHAEKLGVPLIKHDYQTDPSAVGFDAIKYAKNHNIDVVLIDTAGRMHTKTNLLAEMEKICRVTSPDLKVFVAESIAGNDATEQAKAFNEMIGIDGSILSKADIDEKGGTIISVSHATRKPIFYLGTGQNYSDLKLFNKDEYIESLGL